MNTPANRPPERPLRTSDLAAAASRPTRQEELDDEGLPQQQGLAEEPDIPEDQLAGEDELIAEDHAITDDQAISEDQPIARERPQAAVRDSERLDPLFSADLAADFRSRWTAVQSNFVDDPRQAVQQGDELVAQVMQSLARTFADEREKLEAQLHQTGEASTENLRIALRRYRSFFERLLSL